MIEEPDPTWRPLYAAMFQIGAKLRACGSGWTHPSSQETLQRLINDEITGRYRIHIDFSRSCFQICDDLIPMAAMRFDQLEGALIELVPAKLAVAFSTNAFRVWRLLRDELDTAIDHGLCSPYARNCAPDGRWASFVRIPDDLWRHVEVTDWFGGAGSISGRPTFLSIHIAAERGTDGEIIPEITRDPPRRPYQPLHLRTRQLRSQPAIVTRPMPSLRSLRDAPSTDGHTPAPTAPARRNKAEIVASYLDELFEGREVPRGSAAHQEVCKRMVQEFHCDVGRTNFQLGLTLYRKRRGLLDHD